VLFNHSPDLAPFGDVLGEHLRQRFSGLPAYSLDYVRIPAGGGLIGLLRVYAAHWITMLAAGAFISCLVLFVQGLTAQVLPRRYFLRVSSFLQMAAFCLFVSVYFLQPTIAGPEAIRRAKDPVRLPGRPRPGFLASFNG
jgi:hypothetical protein